MHRLRTFATEIPEFLFQAFSLEVLAIPHDGRQVNQARFNMELTKQVEVFIDHTLPLLHSHLKATGVVHPIAISVLLPVMAG